MGTSTPKGDGVEAGLPRKARVSQEWPRVSRGGEASDGASPCESRGQARGVPGWWS